MKFTTQLMAALAGLGLVSQAMATDPVVYLTGSTAFRSTVFKALSDQSGTTNGIFMPGSLTFGTWGNASASSGNYMVFHGELTNAGAANGQLVYVDCAWSGSEAGIASACGATLTNTLRDGVLTNLNGSPETWVDYPTATLAAAPAGNVQSGSPGKNGAPANGAQLEASSHIADLAQADTSQAISFTPVIPGSTPAAKLTQLVPFGTEAVVTFTVSRNVNPTPSQDWLDCSNITLPQLNIMLANGLAPASFISGNTNDQEICYLVGRNFGSGTRMNMLADSSYGAHKAVIQNSIGNGVDPRDPAQSVTTLLLQNEGNNGYESGGNVAKAMSNTGGSSTTGSCQQADPINPGTNWFAMCYVGPSDALNTGNNGGQTPPLFLNTNNWVTVDGEFSSNASIERGQWWLWGNEYLYGKNGISGIQNSVGNALFNAVISQVISQNFGVAPGGHDPGIPYSLMNVSKASDSAFPSF